MLELRFRVIVERDDPLSEDSSNEDEEFGDGDYIDPGVRHEDEFVCKVTMIPAPSDGKIGEYRFQSYLGLPLRYQDLHSVYNPATCQPTVEKHYG